MSRHSLLTVLLLIPATLQLLSIGYANQTFAASTPSPAQVVHAPRRHAADPGFLNDANQGVLRRLARLQEGREAATLP